MNGFFTQEKLNSFVTKVKTPLQECNSCGLHLSCKNPKIKVSGKGEMGILLVGGFPSDDDDNLGIPFSDRAGIEFSSILKMYGVDINRDCWKTYACLCTSKKDPTENQIQACKHNLKATIQTLKPKFIWVMGSISVKSFFGIDFNSDMNLWRGQCIPDQKYNAWLLPIFEPKSLIHYQKDPNFLSQYNRDIKNAVVATNKKAPTFVDPQSKVKVITDFTEICNKIQYFNFNRMIFDYETTGLKPYRAGHKIVSIAFSNPIETVSFPFDKGIFTLRELEIIRNLWIAKLKDPNISKVAHNFKYEEEWSQVILETPVINWEWCTMTNAHILDNRRGSTGLNFQLYSNFGIRPYDSYIDPFKKEIGNGLNRMLQADTYKLCLYGGIDSAGTQMLFDKQRIEFERKGDGLNRARAFFHEGLQSLSVIERNGFPVSEEYYARTSTVLSDTLCKIKGDISQDPIYKKFEKEYYHEPDIQSNDDLKIIVYKYLKADERKTDKGNLITDKSVLEKINHPFTNNIREYRRYKHISDFVNNMVKFSYKGKVHGSFDLNMAISYRSNASNPNLTNINVRDEVAKRFCRSGFIASESCRLLSSDFSGVEVSMGACIHKDPKMIEYLTCPTTDMHRDCACDIWCLPSEEIAKMIRFYAKNCWTFPQFYGDWFKSCAESLWENVIGGGLKTNSGMLVIDHLLQNTNIRHFDDFVEHCKEIERIFWQERFKVYDQWKKDINDFYRRNGYIESPLGFRYTGVISRKDASNYIIQGLGFHVLLWTINKVIAEIKKREMKSQTVCEIHDDQIHNSPENEWEDLIKIIDFYGTIEIRKQFEWISVPLKIEHELTGIGGCWTDKEPIVRKDGIWYFDRKTGLVPVKG